jgi:hypothetical protein
VKSSVIFYISFVDCCTIVNEQPHNMCVTIFNSVNECCFFLEVSCFNITIVFNQHSADFLSSICTCQHQSCFRFPGSDLNWDWPALRQSSVDLFSMLIVFAHLLKAFWHGFICKLNTDLSIFPCGIKIL